MFKIENHERFGRAALTARRPDADLSYVKISGYRGTTQLTLMVRERNAWCEENVGEQKVDWDYLGLGVFVFDDPKSAMMFKLIYG